ncbi:MAG: 5'-3' exonuclease H3TH domain-containing protein [Lysobacterales bacterium]
MSPAAELHLVDASVYVFRAYFSVPNEMTDRDGNATNAVYGFTGFLCSLLEQARPKYLGIAFDESLESSFRNDIDPSYKANRDPAPLELKRQFAHCRAVAEAMGIECFSDDRFEADDLIGTLARLPKMAPLNHVIVSSDKDLAQLLRPQDHMWDFARNIRMDYSGVKDKFGVTPEQIADYLALTGDAVDNIKGIPGIGPKAATAVLNHFGTLEEALERSPEFAFLSHRGAKSIATKLKNHAEEARLARRLTDIACDAPLPSPPPELTRKAIDASAVHDLLDYLNFGTGLRQRIARLGDAD